MNNKEEATASSPSIFGYKNSKKYLLLQILMIIINLKTIYYHQIYIKYRFAFCLQSSLP